jgi:Fe-S-cluster containining protein
MEGDLATLCQSCGLCCDGSLFGRVDLGPDEVEPMRKRRLRITDGGRTFEQPCAALTSGETAVKTDVRVCSIYDQRPSSCHRFVCRLYDRHEREGGPLEPRLAAVRRVRELVAALESHGLAPAEFAELTKRLEDDFARARSS